MVECDKTQQFAVTSKLSEKVIEWFILGNAANYSDVAIGAESKAEAVTLYAEPLVAKGLLKAATKAPSNRSESIKVVKNMPNYKNPKK